MHRIDTTREWEIWAWGCPAEEHRNWRPHSEGFQCITCGEIYDALVHLPSGETVDASEIELVASDSADSQERGRP